jgi:polysaccharide export outer membrane protein
MVEKIMNLQTRPALVTRAGLALMLMLAWVVTTAVAQTGTAANGTAAAQPLPAPDAATLQAAETSQYIIGPGDGLHVFVWRNPELTTSVVVRPDGEISMPLVDHLVAVGKTPSQLSRDIEKVLGEFVRQPQVNVIVTTAVSTFSQVKVVGQVTKPTSLPFRKGMTVLDALLQAGGLTPFAAGNRSRIVRTEGGKKTEITVKLDRLLNKGDTQYNITLEPGDLLVVPESRF